jgi:hypothetical protein
MRLLALLTLCLLVLAAAPALCAVFDLELDEEEANFVPVSEFGLDEGGYIEVNITNVRSRSTLSPCTADSSPLMQYYRLRGDGPIGFSVLRGTDQETAAVRCGNKFPYILIMSHVLAAEMAGTAVRVQLLSGALAGCRPPAHEHDDWVRLTCKDVFIFFSQHVPILFQQAERFRHQSFHQ